MKEEFLQAYQKRIEEIKTLNISPEEKRGLAAKAKDEILSQYKESYISEKETPVAETPVNTETPVIPVPIVQTEQEDLSAIPVNEDDPINGILNKFEEREQSGQVGIKPLSDVDPDANGIFSPDDLFSTMSVGELFDGMDLDADDQIEVASVEPTVLATEDVIEPATANNFQIANESLSEFDLNSPQPASVVDDFNLTEDVDSTNPFNLNQTPEPAPAFAKETPSNLSSPTITSGEVDAVVTEVKEGSLNEEPSNMVDVNLDEKSMQELDELEKQRDKSQKLGIIEILLMLVLVVLVAVVLYILANQ